MTLLAITLIIASAFMHAGWNLLSKSRHPPAAFFLVASVVGAVILSPFLVMHLDVVVRVFSVRLGLLVAGTGLSMAVYYAALAAAYRAGDISVAYPLARSSPVIVVAVVTFVLGRGDQVTALGVLGIVLVVGGCFLVPLRRVADLRPGNFLNACCGFALLAAVGTAGYSILDDEALRLLRSHPELGISNTPMTLMYACLEAASGSLWMLLFVAWRRQRRAGLKHVWRTQLRSSVLAGVAIHLTYALVLIAMAFVDNVSYVVGFRQLSIPLGALAGILILKEPPHRPKLAGVAIMLAGLVLLALA